MLNSDFRREINLVQIMANDLDPTNRRVRILITHSGCPKGKKAKRAVLKFNRIVPPERRIDIEEIKIVDGKIVSENAENPLIDAIFEEYGSTKCPTLIFDGGIYKGILDEEEYFYFLLKLDENFMNI